MRATCLDNPAMKGSLVSTDGETCSSNRTTLVVRTCAIRQTAAHEQLLGKCSSSAKAGMQCTVQCDVGCLHLQRRKVSGARRSQREQLVRGQELLA